MQVFLFPADLSFQTKRIYATKLLEFEKVSHLLGAIWGRRAGRRAGGQLLCGGAHRPRAAPGVQGLVGALG